MPFATLSIKDIKTISGSVIKFVFRVSFLLSPWGIKLFINKSTAITKAKTKETTTTAQRRQPKLVTLTKH